MFPSFLPTERISPGNKACTQTCILALTTLAALLAQVGSVLSSLLCPFGPDQGRCCLADLLCFFSFLGCRAASQVPSRTVPCPAPAALPLHVPGISHTPCAGHCSLQVSQKLETASWLCLMWRRAEPSAAEGCKDWSHPQGCFPWTALGFECVRVCRVCFFYTGIINNENSLFIGLQTQSNAGYDLMLFSLTGSPCSWLLVCGCGRTWSSAALVWVPALSCLNWEVS